MFPVILLAHLPLELGQSRVVTELLGHQVLAGAAAGHLHGGGDPDLPQLLLLLLTHQQQRVVELPRHAGHLLHLENIEQVYPRCGTSDHQP